MRKIFILILLSFIFTSIQAKEPFLRHTNILVANGKNVLLLFEKKTCPYCKKIKNDIKNNKTLYRLLKNNFNVYSIPLDEYHEYRMGDKNPLKKTNTTSLKMRFFIKATPQIIMFDKKWNKIIQIPGYVKPDTMKIFVNYIVKGIYKKEDLKIYLIKMGLVN